MSTPADTSRRPGRPRSERARKAILQAAADLLLAEGTAQVSMDAVAERAGVSKATIYRWWPSKERLALDALLEWAGTGRAPRDTGSLRLKIKPREAQVYVDGYLVGDVDSFDGAFQKLGIESGGHRVELKADGYEPLQFDVLITPGETVTYKGEMKPIK